MSDSEKALRIALLTLESLVLAGGKSLLTFNELAAQYGRDVGVTAQTARAAFEKHIVPVVDGLRASTVKEGE